MSVTELLPTLGDLDRAEKLQVMQFLVSELAKEKKVLLTSETTCSVWSPCSDYEAADALLKALDANRSVSS